VAGKLPSSLCAPSDPYSSLHENPVRRADCAAFTDVEDMTLKSYSYKKFGVFVRMLLTALRRTSDSVSLDLLTSDDLERVKARRSEGGAAVDSSPSRTRKRYLILTYTAEYDHVQYPLPLQLEEQPDVHRLQVRLRKAISTAIWRAFHDGESLHHIVLRCQATIWKLRREIVELKDLGSGLAPDEWQALRDAAAQHHGAGPAATGRHTSSQNGMASDDVAALKERLCQVRSTSQHPG